MEHPRTKVFLLEQNRNLSLAITFAMESRFNFEVVAVASCEEAKRILSEKHEFMFFILNSAIDDFEAVQKAIDDLRVDVPHFVYENRVKLTEIVKCVEDHFEIDPAQEFEKYTEVNIETFTLARSLSNDVYIKLSSGRLVKLFSYGDRIEQEDVDRYLAKGVHSLYLDKRAASWILKSFGDNIESIVEDEEFKVDLTDDKGDEYADVRDLFEDLQEDEYIESVFEQETEFIDSIKDQSKGVIESMRQSKDLFEMLSKIKVDPQSASFLKNRMKLTSCISCMISRALGWDSPSTYDKLIYSSFLHDIMILDLPLLAKARSLDEVEEALKNGQITEVDKKRYMQHTYYASEMVALDPNAPIDAKIIIKQHHELPEGKGFPAKMSATVINTFAAILAVSIDIAQYLLLSKSPNFQEYLDENKERYDRGPFKKAMGALAELTHCKF